MSRANKTNFAIGWFLRNWHLVIVVGAGIFTVGISVRRGGSWTFTVPLSVIVIGFVLNIVVMIANRGKMPVDTDGTPIDESDHDAMYTETRFPILGDWIPFAGWLLSPGDVLLFIGLLGFVLGRLMQG